MPVFSFNARVYRKTARVYGGRYKCVTARYMAKDEHEAKRKHWDYWRRRGWFIAPALITTKETAK